MTDKEIDQIWDDFIGKFSYIQFLDFCIWFADKVDKVILAKNSDPQDIITVWEMEHE